MTDAEYYSNTGEFTDSEMTLLEVWAQIREPAPGEYTIGSQSRAPLTIQVHEDGRIGKASS